MAPAAALILLASWQADADPPDLRIGGRLHLDFFFADADARAGAAPGGEPTDGAEVRRARIRASGRLAPEFAYLAEFDFAVEAELRELSLRWTEAGPGTLKAGFFKEPVGLDRLTSSKYLTFTEENAAASTLGPGRNSGVAWFRGDERWHLAGGLFRALDPAGRSEDASWGISGRAVWRPWVDAERGRVLHLGVSALRKEVDEALRFRARPEAHAVEHLVDTGPLAADSWTGAAIEAAWMRGPWHAQAEWHGARLRGAGDPVLRGASAQAGWFLTGESRGYDAAGAAFHRVRPRRPWGPGGGLGAWEVAARHTVLDLSATAAVPHAMRSTTLALNGYLQDFSRVQLDWTRAQTADQGTVDVITLRFAVEW